MHDLAFDEESFREKVKRKAGVFTLIGSGLLSVVHTLSHIVPAIGILGFSLGENSGFFYTLVSNEYMQFAYIPFVFLSFWYMYRDHKHHKHEKELRQENENLKVMLKKK
jgi:hypothetical protein